MKFTFIKFAIIFSILIIESFIITSCDKAHDDIYGEQKITITNVLNSSATIEIISSNGSESKILGSVSGNSTKTFNVNWRNDCNYKFIASWGGGVNASTNKNICGGASWTIP